MTQPFTLARITLDYPQGLLRLADVGELIDHRTYTTSAIVTTTTGQHSITVTFVPNELDGFDFTYTLAGGPVVAAYAHRNSLTPADAQTMGLSTVDAQRFISEMVRLHNNLGGQIETKLRNAMNQFHVTVPDFVPRTPPPTPAPRPRIPGVLGMMASSRSATADYDLPPGTHWAKVHDGQDGPLEWTIVADDTTLAVRA